MKARIRCDVEDGPADLRVGIDGGVWTIHIAHPLESSPFSPLRSVPCEDGAQAHALATQVAKTIKESPCPTR